MSNFMGFCASIVNKIMACTHIFATVGILRKHNSGSSRVRFEATHSEKGEKVHMANLEIKVSLKDNGRLIFSNLLH